MRKSRFTEDQIIGISRVQEAGVSTAGVRHKHEIGSATFFKWKVKFGGMDVSDARKLKQLEDENGKLKRLLAEAMLDIAMLQDLNAKNGDARGQAGSRGASHGTPRDQPAAGVQGDCGNSRRNSTPPRVGGSPASPNPLPRPALTPKSRGSLIIGHLAADPPHIKK